MGDCVVIGYDGSATAKRALNWALARSDGAKIVVAHAYEPPHEWLGSPRYDNVLHQHLERGEKLLAELPDDDRIETELLSGRAAEAIARVASVRNADEIIVGSRGFGPVRGALGSTSHELLGLADRPVVVIPPPAD
jgi:nucleotide-binding universal stress UspA family protein